MKSYTINARLVCTHLTAFFMLNPNMAMWILKKYLKNLGISELFADDTHRVEKAMWAVMWGYIELGKCLLLGVGLSAASGYRAEVWPKESGRVIYLKSTISRVIYITEIEKWEDILTGVRFLQNLQAVWINALMCCSQFLEMLSQTFHPFLSMFVPCFTPISKQI